MIASSFVRSFVRLLLRAGVQSTLEKRGIGRCVQCMCVLGRVEEGTVGVSSLSGLSKFASSRCGLLSG